MVTYFCYFGDGEVGGNFKKVMFGETKLIPLLKLQLQEKNISSLNYSVLIKYFIDGNITQYMDVENNTVFLDKKNNVIVVSYKLSKQEAMSMNLYETYKYISDSTFKALASVESKLNNQLYKNSLNELNSVIKEVFFKILNDNVIINPCL